MSRVASARSKRLAAGPLAAAALALLCLAVYLPGIASIPAVDRDEARFAQASRQMFEAHALPPDQRDPAFHSGGWAVPMLLDKPRLGKPPLIYWLQVGSAYVFTAGDPSRDAIWIYRVPSVCAAALAVFATWWFGKRWTDPRAALLAAALLAVAPMIVWDAHQARADQLLLACTTLAMFALAEVWRSARRGRPALRWALLFWVALAAGVMTKGFITPMVAGLTVLALGLAHRSWRWTLALRPALGAVVVALAVVPWLLAVARHQGGIGPYLTIIWNEFFVRGAAGSREGHFAPPGAHTVLLTALFWPGSMLTLAGVLAAWKRARGVAARAPSRAARLRARWAGRPLDLFLLAWVLPAWAVFELSPAKLPHYTMPMYPALALLSSRAVFAAASRVARGAPVMPFSGRAIWFAVGAVPLALGMAASIVGAFRLWPAAWSGLTLLSGPALLVPAALCAVGGWALLRADASLRALRPVRAQTLAIAAVVVFLAAALGWWAPRLAPGAAARDLAALLQQADPARERPWATVFSEESVQFSTRGRARRVPRDPDAVVVWLAAHPRGLIIAPDAPAFADLPGARTVARWSGLNASGGGDRWLVLEPAP